MSAVPDTYLGMPVPESLKQRWRTWEAADWRQQQYLNTNRLYPPDERFNVRLPEGMCERHAENWLGYRNMRFDPVKGDAWPGNAGSPFLFVGTDMEDLREQRRAEWDEKASQRMHQVEQICRGGRGDGCFPRRKTAKVIHLPAARAEAVADAQLAGEAS
ncbi:hypothetical protein ABZ725_14060 [Streptomyces sp. NPDC006872]|uniref:hypothetical protein n=1 Tax=Streptomyces sp. NPDC006872 TaxID=3155720 RepID=UPI0033D7B2E0